MEGIYHSLPEAMGKSSCSNQISIYEVGGKRVECVWLEREKADMFEPSVKVITSMGVNLSKIAEDAPKLGKKRTVFSHVVELSHPFLPFDLLRHFSGDRMYAVVADMNDPHVAEVLVQEHSVCQDAYDSCKLDLPIWYLGTSPCESVPQGTVQTRFYYAYFPSPSLDRLLDLYIPEEARLPWQVAYVEDIRKQLAEKSKKM